MRSALLAFRSRKCQQSPSSEQKMFAKIDSVAQRFMMSYEYCMLFSSHMLEA